MQKQMKKINSLRAPYTLILLSLLSFLFLTQLVFAGDRNWRNDHPFGRGNERSERPSRVENNAPIYRGNGCPEGSARIAFAPDNLSFTLIFDKFVADVMNAPPPPPPGGFGGNNGNGRGGRGDGRGNRGGGAPGRDRMTCNIVVPLQIPPNMQMSISRIDYRGFAELPAGAKGMLDSLFTFYQRDRRGDDSNEGEQTRLHYIFEGPRSDNYELSSGVLNPNGTLPANQVSPCGGRVRLRIQNDLRLMVRPGETAPAQITIDSVDASTNAVYQVNWTKCQSTRPF